MKTYRMDINASVCVTVQAESEEQAIKLAEKAIEDFESGFELPDGEGYSDAVMYTSSEESAEVVDVEETEGVA